MRTTRAAPQAATRERGHAGGCQEPAEERPRTAERKELQLRVHRLNRSSRAGQNRDIVRHRLRGLSPTTTMGRTALVRRPGSQDVGVRPPSTTIVSRR